MRDVIYDRMTKIIGSPNNISHSSLCAEAEKFGPYYTEGIWSYRQYDVLNAHYVLLWGADPLAANRQVSYYSKVWGDVVDKATIAIVEPRLSASAGKADEWLPIKPGQDGALAVSISHILLTEGLWYKPFVGDFTEGKNLFISGQTVDEEAFEELHTNGIAKYWNLELRQDPRMGGRDNRNLCGANSPRSHRIRQGCATCHILVGRWPLHAGARRVYCHGRACSQRHRRSS